MQTTWEKFSLQSWRDHSHYRYFSLRATFPVIVFGWADIKGALTPDEHPWISCFSGLESIWSAQVPRAQGSTQTACCIYRWSQRKVPVRAAVRTEVCVTDTHTHHYRSAAVTLCLRPSATLHRCRGVEWQIPAAQCVTGGVVLLMWTLQQSGCVLRRLLSVCGVNDVKIKKLKKAKTVYVVRKSNWELHFKRGL